MNIVSPSLNQLLDTWLDEDIGRGDLTKSALKSHIANATWISKQNGIFCGGELVKCIYHRLDKSIDVIARKAEGDSLIAGEIIMDLHGPVTSLLAGERTTLNLAMHLSGIATETKRLVTALEGTAVKFTDTRKTTPGLRQLEKYAVRCGGGMNHRLGLDDAAMLKENHIAWSHGIEESIKTLRSNIPWTSKIIVEAETDQQAIEAVSAGADGVLLDEMSPEEIQKLIPQLRKLAQQKSKAVILEASGIDSSQIKQYASTGVDIISSSAPVTKSHWIDFSMRFINKQEGS